MKFKPYPSYKDSGIEWLGEVPEHWEVKPVKNIAKIVNGYPFDSKLFNPTNGFSLIRIRDLNSSEADVYFNGDFVECAAITSDDVLIGMDGDFNVGRWHGVGRALLNQRMCCVRGKSKRLTQLLEYGLPVPLKIINDVAYFTTVKHLSSSQVEKIFISVPPDDKEQTAIANFLDRETLRIDALVEEKNHFIELLKEKRQTLISHVVTKGLDPTVKMKDSGVEWLGEVPEHWTVTKLGFITSKIGSGKTPNGGAEVYTEQGVIFIRSQNVYDTGLVLEDVAYINEEIDASMSGTRVKSGDILLNVTDASIGRTCLVPKDFPDANVNQHVCIIRLKAEKNKDYVSWCLKSNSSKMLINVYQNGAGREGLNFEQISNITVAMPLGSHEIDKVVAYLDNQTTKIDALITETQQSIALLKEHRTALISAAVTGKIDVREVA